MVAELDITYAQLVNSYALNLCGSSLGCIFFIPLAIKYGRRSIYVVSTGAMLALPLGSKKLTTAGDVYATNLLLGLAGAPNETIVQMTVGTSLVRHCFCHTYCQQVADLFFVHQRGTVNGLYMAMVMIGVSSPLVDNAFILIGSPELLVTNRSWIHGNELWMALLLLDLLSIHGRYLHIIHPILRRNKIQPCYRSHYSF